MQVKLVANQTVAATQEKSKLQQQISLHSIVRKYQLPPQPKVMQVKWLLMRAMQLDSMRVKLIANRMVVGIVA